MTDTETQEIVVHADVKPLDLLNLWNAGKVSDNTLFVLMQRHLLNAGTMRVANSESFAQQRSRSRRLSEASDQVEEVLSRLDKQPTLAEKELLISYMEEMIKDHFRPSRRFATNVVRDFWQTYTAYNKGREFFDLIRVIRQSR